MGFKKHLGVAVLYILAVVAMTWPVVVQMDSCLAGEGGDPWQTAWRFESKWRTLVDSFDVTWGGMGSFTEFQKNEFFGGGGPRLVNLSVWPWMGLHALFGQPFAYNLVWLLSYFLAGYGMYLLVGHVLKRQKEGAGGGQRFLEAVAFVSGLYYMFLPFHVAHSMGHFGAMQVQWLPLIVLTVLSIIEKPGFGKALILVGLAITQSWTEHHYALWASVLVFLIILYKRSSLKKLVGSRKGWQVIVLALSLCFIFVILPYFPTLGMAWREGSDLVLGKEQLVRFSADLFAFVTPSVWHSVWGNWFSPVYEKVFTGNVYEATHYLGLFFLLTVVFFQQRVSKKERIFWQGLGLLFLIISLGPRLHVFGVVTDLVLPYEIIDSWPVIEVVRAAARAGVVVGMSMAVMLGLVLFHNINRKVSVAIMVILIAIEFVFVPVNTQSAQLSRVYEEVKSGEGRAIAELPAVTNYRAASKSLFASLRHGKNVVGNIALERAEAKEVYEEVRSFPVLRQILFLRTTHILEARNEFFEQEMVETLTDVLRWLDVKMMVVHPDSLSEKQNKAVEELMMNKMKWSKSEYEDAILYRDEGKTNGDGVFISRDSGWKNVGYDPDKDCVFAELPGEVGLTVYNANNRNKKLVLEWTKVESDVTIAADGLLSDKNNSRRRIELLVKPGVTNIKIVKKGLKKAIIRDPIMKVMSE